MFDLRSFREESLKLTQKELADLIDERQDKISRLEKKPESIGLDILIKIADKTGTTLDELVHYEKFLPDSLEVNNSWSMVTDVRKMISDYISNAMNTRYLKDKHKHLINDIETFTKKSLTKPKVAIVGLSDTGKSTLINGLLGAEKMPVAWTPTTAISIYVKHVEDRPSYIKDDVWFFKAQLGDRIGWDPSRLDEEVYTALWFAKTGHIQDLNTFAVRRASDDGYIGSAVVFLDSPILKVCDIVDLPGYNTGDRELDNTLTEQVSAYADVLIYMSLANGFMRGNDIEYIKSNLYALPIIEDKEQNNNPLGNLFVVASQAHVVNKGNREHLEQILDQGAQRLYSQIPNEVWDYRTEVTGMSYKEETVRNRFFTYTKDIEDLRAPFEAEILGLIEGYPKLLMDQYKETFTYLCQMNKRSLQEEIKGIEAIIANRNKFTDIVKTIEMNEPVRLNASTKLISDVWDQIFELNTRSKEQFTSAYKEIISVESIIKTIDEEGFTNYKGDMELLGSLLNSRLQVKVQQILKEQSSDFIDTLNDYLENYASLIQGQFEGDASFDWQGFDTRRAFANGLKDQLAIGGLALWGASLGDNTANLLFGKGVNVLSALLYSFYGAPEMTFSSSGRVAWAGANMMIEGSGIALGIGLALLAVTSGMALFGSGWKKSAAKKIVAACTEESVYEAYEASIMTYWIDSEAAFDLASKALENSYLEEISLLKSNVMTEDIKQLESSIDAAKEELSFYEAMPEINLD